MFVLLVATAGHRPACGIGDSELMTDEGVALLQTRAGVVKRHNHANLFNRAVSSADFVRDEGYMCGVCGDGNNLHIGIGGRHFDEVSRANAVDVCGPVCARHEECGGFNFADSLHRCYYRRVTACQRIDNSTHDCYTKSTNASEGLGHFQLAAMRNYTLDQGRMCGACGAENNMALGLHDKLFDTARRETAVEICGTKCSQHKNCGGFNFVESLGSCYYRKRTSCQASKDVDRDCYTKMADSPSNDVVVDEPQAALVLEKESLEKTLRQRTAALRDTKAQLSQLQMELKAKGQKGRDGMAATEVHDVDRAAESLADQEADLDGGDVLQGLVAEQNVQIASSTIGATAVLDQDGYYAVVALNDSSATKEFARRVVTDLGFEVIDEGSLDGLIQFYNKTSEQTYEGLRSELLSASAIPDSWLAVVAKGAEPEAEKLPLLQDNVTNVIVDGVNLTATSGNSAPLDQEGYAAVVALWDNAEMETFVLRAVSQLGCNVTDRGALKGFIPFYSKEKSQSFGKLKAELEKISNMPTSWLATTGNAFGSGSVAQNSTTHQTEKNKTSPEEESRKLAKNSSTTQKENTKTGPDEESMMESESETDSHYHAGDLLAVTANATKMLWQIPTIWDPRSTLQRFNSFTLTGGPSGSTAALSPKGYREVASRNNATEMAVFVQRVADDLDYEIASEDGLMDFISLNNMTELNYTSLEADIKSESQVEGSWVVKRDHGPSKTQMVIGVVHEIVSRASQAMVE